MAGPNLIWQADLQGIHDLVVQGRPGHGGVEVGANADRRSSTGSLRRCRRMIWRLTCEPISSRGYVHVVEQPSLSNGYTLRVRIEDRQDGLYPYRVFISWTGSGHMTKKALAAMGDHKNKHKVHPPEDKVWVVDDKAEKITCGAVWRGNMHGTARLAIREDGVHVISGDAAGEIEKQAGAKPMKSAHVAAALSLVGGVSAKVVEPPGAEKRLYSVD